MIIWRGWGILTIPFVALGLIAIGSISAKPGSPNYLPVGLGLLLGGTLTFLMGYWLNVLRPRQQAETYLEELRARSWQRVQEGTFQLEPGAAAPRSAEEATAQVERLLQVQRQQLLRGSGTRNSLFFIPMHWLGLAICVLGVGFFFGGLLLAFK